MISSRLNAGFRFVSDSVIDSVSAPCTQAFPQTNRGRLRSPNFQAARLCQPYIHLHLPPTPWRSRVGPCRSTHAPLRGFDLRLTCDGSRSRLPRHRGYDVHSLLQQSMPVSLGAFVCMHLIIPKSQKRRGCRCQSWGERERAHNQTHQLALIQLFLSLFFSFCLFNLHQQV